MDDPFPRTPYRERGHYAYYGISGNYRRLRWYAHEVVRVWKKWLSRRDRQGVFTWNRLNALLKRHPLPPAGSSIATNGEWCAANDSNVLSEYKRGRCRDSDGWMVIRANGFDAHEMSCKVIGGNKPSEIRFRCSGEGEHWITNFHMSLQGQLLVMLEASHD